MNAIPRTPFEAGNEAVNRGDYRTALKRYEEAIRSDPHHADAFSGLGSTYFQRGDFKTAVNLFEQGLKYDSDHFVLNNNAAGAHYRLGNTSKALQHWSECLKIDPGNESVMRQMGVARQGRSR